MVQASGLIHDIGSRVRGVVAVALQERVARDIDVLVQLLLDAGVQLWQSTNWASYDKRELNCTVQLYRWCREAKRRDSRFTLMSVQLEWLNVTTPMLEGREDASSASRPDLRMHIGAVGRTIECKRLEPTGGWTRAYVREGLARFVLNKYGQDENVGYLVGYVQAGTPQHLFDDINGQILNHPEMGNSDIVKYIRTARPTSWGTSMHLRPSRSLQVDHLLIDMTADSHSS